MRRSASVTAAAVVALLGSSCVGIIGILAFVGSRLPKAGHTAEATGKHSPISPTWVLAICLALAAIALANAIGLLRLKNWARISTMVFSGSIATLASLFIPIFWFFPSQQTGGADVYSRSSARMVIVVLVSVLLLIALWWLFLFSRKTIAEQFTGQTQEVTRPIGITVIAWIVILFSLLNLIFVVAGKSPRVTPHPFFLFVLAGDNVRIYRRLLTPISLLSCLGLLRNKIWGFWLAVALDVFYLSSLGVFFLLPGGSNRWGKFVRLALAARPPETVPGLYSKFLASLYIVGSLQVMLFLAVLLAAKNEFFWCASRRAGESVPTRLMQN